MEEHLAITNKVNIFLENKVNKKWNKQWPYIPRELMAKEKIF